MLIAPQREGLRPTGGDLLTDTRPRRTGVRVATAMVGLSLAVLVGHDGSPVWRLVRVAVVAVIAAAAIAGQARGSDRRCGRFTAAIGIVAVSIGIGFMPYLVKEGISTVAVAGVAELAAGLALVVAGTVLAVRRVGWMWRLATGVATMVVAAVVAFVVGPAVAATNVPLPELDATPASAGLDYESVTLTTREGVAPAGWYVPSKNRSAVVLLHGAGSTRSNVLGQAAVLARHGFGVLMVDARGHGESGGRAMDFGWHGDADISAATQFLADRVDVDPARIGAVGMSMGGEEALGATATNDVIRAVVAEGATARVARDEAWLSEEFGLRGALQEQVERVQDWVTDALTSASVPTSARAAVEATENTRYLLIAAGDVADEGRAAAYIAGGAPSRVARWIVPGAGHTDGLETQPEEWERRVVTFLTDALGAGPDNEEDR